MRKIVVILGLAMLLNITQVQAASRKLGQDGGFFESITNGLKDLLNKEHKGVLCSSTSNYCQDLQKKTCKTGENCYAAYCSKTEQCQEFAGTNNVCQKGRCVPTTCSDNEYCRKIGFGVCSSANICVQCEVASDCMSITGKASNCVSGKCIACEVGDTACTGCGDNQVVVSGGQCACSDAAFEAEGKCLLYCDYVKSCPEGYNYKVPCDKGCCCSNIENPAFKMKVSIDSLKVSEFAIDDGLKMKEAVVSK